MSQSPPAIVGPHKPPVKIIDDSEAALADLRKVLPDDVKLLTADGEVWANRAMLSARSDYFSAMLDVSKFQEGTESAGDLSQYSREVVNKVVNYCYCGVILCQVRTVPEFLISRLIISIPGYVAFVSSQSRGTFEKNHSLSSVRKSQEVHRGENDQQGVPHLGVSPGPGDCRGPGSGHRH